MWRHRRRSDVEAQQAQDNDVDGGAAQARGSPGGMPCTVAVLAAARVVADGEHAPAHRLAPGAGVAVAGLRDADAGSPTKLIRVVEFMMTV